ncbi:TBC1 domain family member 15 isoform X2 [Selaginella moellendorffii]|uniref:TBC1 domain family member 15 isoform X2 n=1 Tax=Selaginella moellendorffii TaxID=88036 RepID=UPI000D1CB91E|nr:TBC1 domain family member 15 isoform X2 [Selaginella moellendorffii]|eukprot:XP_024533139.1 TBC1 domain family member 15 isoform X2 [Selaginella moellendorffii]
MGRKSEARSAVAVKEGNAAPGDEDYELLYSKDYVAIHPSWNERINGQLRLIKQGFSVFMSWMPSSDPGRKQRGPSFERDRSLYTIRAVALEEMKSIRRHTPPFGWQYIIVVLNSGLAFPPLYFHNGGVREFLGTLREYSQLGRAGDDPNVYLVNDIQDPLQKSLSSLELADVPRASLMPISRATKTEIMEDKPQRSEDDSTSNDNVQRPPRHRDPNFSLQVLEKFSMVTKFARDTTTQLMNGLETLNVENAKRPSTLTMEAVPERIVSFQEAAATSEQGENGEASTNVGSFELVDGTQEDELPDIMAAREPPLGKSEWNSFLDGEGRVTNPNELKKRIFRGGVEPSMRPLVWKFLLEFFSFDSTSKERDALLVKRREEYRVLKAQWQAKRFSKFRERKSRIEKDVVRTDRATEFYGGDDNPNVDMLRDILITYSFYNFDLGYCQGMSDLLSPILFVMRDEEEAFWSFASLMERLGPNFHRDQNGMHSQLLALSKLVQLLDPPLQEYFGQVECLNYFFCFRWILIQFKREFVYDDVLALWEVLWTRHMSEHFHLYICVALLKRHRRKIMDEHMVFDTLLKFINELSGHINLVSTLHGAETLCRLAGDAGAACIPPGTPPALSRDPGAACIIPPGTPPALLVAPAQS